MNEEKLSLSDKLSQQRTAMSTDRTQMSVERTLMSADRTLMSWTRTSLSMISFGFTIYKFLQGMQAEGALPLFRPEGPRHFGLALVVIGGGSLTMACFQYWFFVRKIGRPEGKSPWSLTLVVACLLSLISILVLINMFWRVGPF